MHETTLEGEQGRASHGMRPLKRLSQLDLLGPGFIGGHMTQLTDEEIAEYALTGASVVHCRESNLKLASGFYPVAKLLDDGIKVALGTEGLGMSMAAAAHCGQRMCP